MKAPSTLAKNPGKIETDPPPPHCRSAPPHTKATAPPPNTPHDHIYIQHTPTKTSPQTPYPSVAAPILNFSIFKGFVHYFLKTHNETPDLIN